MIPTAALLKDMTPSDRGEPNAVDGLVMTLVLLLSFSGLSGNPAELLAAGAAKARALLLLLGAT